MRFFNLVGMTIDILARTIVSLTILFVMIGSNVSAYAVSLAQTVFFGWIVLPPLKTYINQQKLDKKN